MEHFLPGMRVASNLPRIYMLITYFHPSNNSRRSLLFLKTIFFRYLQVRSFIRSAYPRFPNLPEPTSLYLFLTPLPTMKGIISVLYSLVHSINPASLRTIKTLWEDDLQCEIQDDVWDECFAVGSFFLHIC